MSFEAGRIGGLAIHGRGRAGPESNGRLAVDQTFAWVMRSEGQADLLARLRRRLSPDEQAER
jgi:hypothetical protein